MSIQSFSSVYHKCSLKILTDCTLQLFLSDPEAKFSSSIGWTVPGGRTGRYAIIIDHGKVTYAAVEREANALEVSIKTFSNRESLY